MLADEEYLYFIDESLTDMVKIVTELGDDLANRRPRLEGTNSPYAMLFHCLGVLEFWGGHMVAGRTIRRDREAEFHAHGTVAEIAELTGRARERLVADLATAEPLAPPRGRVGSEITREPMARTQEAVLLHLVEELARHHGQMELTRDILRADPGPG